MGWLYRGPNNELHFISKLYVNDAKIVLETITFIWISWKNIYAKYILRGSLNLYHQTLFLLDLITEMKWTLKKFWQIDRWELQCAHYSFNCCCCSVVLLNIEPCYIMYYTNHATLLNIEMYSYFGWKKNKKKKKKLKVVENEMSYWVEEGVWKLILYGSKW